MKVLNFGSMNLDYVYQVEHLVKPGETLSARSQEVVCGGKGLNQSIALAKAGVNVFHAGCVGKGGDMLIDMLTKSGVDVTFVQSVNELQGNAIIQVDQNGQNSIILFGGSNQCISKNQIEETLSKFDAGDYLVLQNEINLLPEIVNLAYEREMKIVLNPSPYNEKLADVDFSKLTWLFINEVEAAQIAGCEDMDKAWSVIHEKYPKLSVLITLGSEGSICHIGEENYIQKAKKVVAVDTTAAGDTYTGFFLAGLMKNKDISECMRTATIASAISVTRKGAGPSIPSLQEVIDESN